MLGVAALHLAAVDHDRDALRTTWQRAGGVLVATLLAFGLVRLIVKKLVNGLLAQPSDAIFGFLIGSALGAAVLFAWAHSGLYLEYSYLAKELSAYVR